MSDRKAGSRWHGVPVLRVARAVVVLLALMARGAQANAISDENALPGTAASVWDGISGAGDPSIQGFATDISVNRGSTVHFKITTDAAAYRIDIYRLGWYGGDGARLQGSGVITATLPQAQPAPLEDAASGLVDCGNWSESAHWDVPVGAISGIYIARLTRDDNSAASHIAFVVRDDASHSDLQFQTSDGTWQAYNVYGGNSLYTGTAPFPSGHAAKVSYNRPFVTRGGGGGSGSSEDWLFNAEYPMVRWLERNGYDVSYSTDVDSDRRGSLILNHKAFLSVGHDEYWSAAQRANVEAARAAGVHLAFFGGNEVYWKTRYEPSIDGTSTSYRTLVCYKEGTDGENVCGGKCDPLTNTWTGLWRSGCNFSPPADGCRPENALSGNISWDGSTGAIEVPDTYKSLRFWRNTSVATLGSGQTATLSGSTLGYEWDWDQFAASYPAGRIRMSSTTLGGHTHHLSLYRHASGALVFGAGTVQWAWGLDGTHDRGASTPDVRMQQATLNLFADMGAQPATIQSGLASATASSDTQAPISVIALPLDGASLPSGTPVTISGSASDAGGVMAGVEVSVDGGATWLPASGTTIWTFAWTPGALGSVTIKSRGVDDSGNLEIPGSGETPANVIAVTVTAAAPPTCPCSIFLPTDVPAVGAANDGSPIELGVKLRASVDGFITGIRFYKGSGNTGTHIGQLWTSGGTLLAQATFGGESASGWQEVALPSAIAVTAGTTYVAAYHSGAGYYAYTNPFFTAATVHGPLSALANGDDGPNAVYKYTASPAFPTDNYQSSNYWVDVVFTTSTGPDVTPPGVSARTPASGASGVATSVSPSAAFDEALDGASVNGSTVTLLGPGTTPVTGTVSYDSGTHIVRYSPGSSLDYSTSYTMTLRGGATDPRVTDVAGNALAADVSWSFTTAAPPPPPPTEGPGGPILVISVATNPFSRYLVEILRSEGLNEFTAMDVSLVNATVLAAYDVVLLGEMSLSAGQVTLLSDWVQAGGTLIAMRPDAPLAGLLGLTPAGGTLANAYLKVNASTGPGVGIVDQTMQFHGVADRYSLSGATAVASLYSAASVATSDPAVSTRAVGGNGGRAIAFAYDLARSVVTTRQGNPAWAGQERDGIAPKRSDDLFFGAAAGDPQSDWIDLAKIAIPQADEQQRLLVNLIVSGSLHRKPLPRFWYLPKGKKAAVVMTGDDHGDAGMQPRFDIYRAESPLGCSVDDWECVRATGYLYVGTTFTPAQASFYDGLGFEVAVHVNTGCADWDAASLESNFASQLAQFGATYPALPAIVTNRTHCIAFSDWSTEPEIELAHGIRFDTNYYFWPPTWVQDRPGLFTGSAMPMRFAKLDGSMIDVYQAPTQMTDESGQSYPATMDSLLERALGVRGYYGVFCANMHFDYNNHSSSNAIVASALARGVPVVSARQMLTWLDGRNGSSFGNVSASANQLSFTIAVGAGARNLQAMVPVHAESGLLTSLLVNGSPVTPTIETIKGIAYALFPATAGSVVAQYTSDSTPPAITAVTATPGAGGTAQVTWTTDEVADSRVDFGTSAAALTSSASDGALVQSHVVTLTGLASSTTYHYRVTSADASLNAATSPASPAAPLTFTMPGGPCAADLLAADFALGTPATDTYLSLSGDGEVILAPASGAEFTGSTLPGNWQSSPWAGGGSALVAGGKLALNGARAGTATGFGSGRTMEFAATFRGSHYQHVGFVADIDFNSPWAIVSTGNAGDGVYARASDGSNILLSGALLGSPHRYRIDWNAGSFVFYVDGTQSATINLATGGPLLALASDLDVDGVALDLDWLRVSPYAAAGSYTSRVFDAGGPANWGAATWTATVPSGASLSMHARQGGTPVPDGSWTAFAPIASSGSSVGGNARYLQYRADLATTVAALTPVLDDVQISCSAGPDITAPAISARSAMPAPDGLSALITWTTDELASSRVDYGLSAGALTSSSMSATLVSAHSASLTGLAPGTVYYYRVTSADAASNTSTDPNPPGAPATFTTPAPPPALCATDASAADFLAGSLSGTQVGDLASGEVTLVPSRSAEFDVLPPSGEWQSFAWNAGGTSAVSGGSLVVDGARFNTEPESGYPPGRSLEFVATFSPAAYQHVGFGGGGDLAPNEEFNTSPWALFSTGASGSPLLARCWNGGSFLDFTIPGSWIGAPHRYRIDWGAASVDFSIDGTLVHSEAIAIGGSMRPGISDYALGGGSISVDWIRMTPYASPGTFTSRVFDAGAVKQWGAMDWTADLPVATALGMSARRGDTPTPDGTWSPFAPVAASGAVVGGTSRYIQYRADLSSADPARTPALRDVAIHCAPAALSSVAAQVPSGASGCVSNSQPCLSVSVVFTRTESATARALSVLVQLSPELRLCNVAVPASSVHQGGWLSGYSSAFQVVDLGSGLYQVDQTVLGASCGPTSGGTVFSLDLTNSGSDGSGTISVTEVTAQDCANAAIAAQAGAPASVSVDRSSPPSIADLAASPAASGNGTDGTTRIQLAFTAPGDGSTVEVYRAPFGNYPEYDDGGTPGSVPALPAYPPPARWTLVPGLVAPGGDEPATRDFWYYVAFTKDACGNVTASNRTGGTLNYHLGDASNGVTACAGDNHIDLADISFLGGHYGAALGTGDPLECLDVGPTTDLQVTSRPTTDHVLDFEDLVPMAVGFQLVSGPQARLRPTASTANQLSVRAVTLPAIGGVLEVPIEFEGSGNVQALSVQFSWGHQVLEWIGASAGPLLNAQAVAGVVLSSKPGDVDVAVLGTGQGVRGSGTLAVGRFRVIGSGDPQLAASSVRARDSANQPVVLGQSVAVAAMLPAHTALGLIYPNPVRDGMTVEFALRRGAPVKLSLYDLAGRRVRRLVDQRMEPGEHRSSWDGRDDDGAPLSSGFYVLRMEAGEVVQNRSVRVVR